MLEAINLTKAYDNLLVLDGVAFKIEKNQICGFTWTKW